MVDQQHDLVADLLEPISRTPIVQAVEAVLGVSRRQAERIVAAFDEVVSKPLEANLSKLRGKDLAKRNPMIYTVRGTETVSDWVDRVLADRETSAIEGHLGTFLEEVARIVSGGIKPGSGVDLQIDIDDDVIRLYAIQASYNTKNSASKLADVEALRRGARALRAHRRSVEMYIGVLSGRAKSAVMRSASDVTVLGSDDFWLQISGIPDFRARLLRASLILSWLVRKRSQDDVARIRAEAIAAFGHSDGSLDIEALAAAATAGRSSTQPVENGQ